MIRGLHGIRWSESVDSDASGKLDLLSCEDRIFSHFVISFDYLRDVTASWLLTKPSEELRLQTLIIGDFEA